MSGERCLDCHHVHIVEDACGTTITGFVGVLGFNGTCACKVTVLPTEVRHPEPDLTMQHDPPNPPAFELTPQKLADVVNEVGLGNPYHKSLFAELASSKDYCTKTHKKHGCWLEDGHEGGCEGPDDDDLDAYESMTKGD